MLLCASREGRRRSILPTHKTPRSSNTARGPWPVFPESSRSGRRTDCRRWSRPLGVCRPCPARVRRLRGFACAICECDRGPSVVLDLCVITRGERVRYYLAIGVSSAGSRAKVSRLDAGVVRRRAAVVSAPTAATERPRRHWCRGCRSDGVLWLQVGALAVCTHAVAAMRAANIGYERCRRKPMRRLDRLSPRYSRSCSQSELASCKTLGGWVASDPSAR